uniref:Uncharacterized protein LOC104227100 n=1 Tax=Nicotiana sylvestris TaxID=4096 RepID=A0A1U7WJT0_NICSY|nr:PREDICTED: uncharacterized protein LOC104227100 [Nicotiana sylvestris]
MIQIPRDENIEADALANLASAANVASDANTSVIHLFHSVLDLDKNEYGTVPDDKRKAHALRKKAARCCLNQGNLYRKMFGGPLARCLDLPKWRAQITEFFQSWQIKRITSTPYHPVGNGQAESTNKIIINNLKKHLQEAKGNWPEVLPGVLRAYRTTAKTSTGETPFSLVYEAEALIPVEIGEPSTRFMQATEESNSKDMRVFQSTKAVNSGKLSPTWEGPYRICDIAGKGAYELETMDKKVLPSHWNVVYLKRYYF